MSFSLEKESSSIRSWLDRCEMICCPDIHQLSADKVKLRNELQNIQVSALLAAADVIPARITG